MKLEGITTSTPDGDFHLIIDEQGIARASGFGTLIELRKRLPADLQNVVIERREAHPYQNHIADYYAGDATTLHRIPHMQTGTEFQKAVWNAMSQIPHGKTASYKELAEAAGKPAAVRAAGTICGLNKLILLVPCHRIVKSDGSVGSYLYGPRIKASLLRHESEVIAQ